VPLRGDRYAEAKSGVVPYHVRQLSDSCPLVPLRG
jgi:hypothetical protein